MIHNIAIIGAGYWGPNLIKTFNDIPNTTIKYVADKLEGRRNLIKKNFPNITVIDNVDEILNDNTLNVVVIATPVEYHYELAKQSLKKGKNIFVEKPFTSNSKEAKELVRLAEDKSLCIGVGHLFTFHPAIEYAKEFINSENSFIPYYLLFNRANLRPPLSKLNVIWDLAVHDIAVANYLYNEFPIEVNAIGYDYANKGLIDMACLTLTYSKNKTANIHVGWHTPNKTRNFQLYGNKWSLFFDDLSKQKLQIFDQGIDNRKDQKHTTDTILNYKPGKVLRPIIKNVQPLYNECSAYLNSIKNKTHYRNNGMQGYQVVKTCEELNKLINIK